MHNLLRMQEHQCLANLPSDLTYYTSRQRLTSLSINHFGQVATLHEIHHDALLAAILVYKLLLEAHNVCWTGVTMRMQCDFLINCGQICTFVLQCDIFHCKHFPSEAVLHKMNLAPATSAKLSPDQILIKWRLEALGSEQIHVALLLCLLTGKV